jgi:sensor c-di-GMP phosphodiesterase-like protein
MNKETITFFALIIALAAIISPVWIAIDQSRREGLDVEMDHMRAYARDVLQRSDSTAEQVDIGIKKLEDAHSNDPCSVRNIAIMRDIDLSSSYIQAIGHVSGNRLICSSLGNGLSGFYLGPVDLVTPSGVKLRQNIKFPFTGETTFLGIERDGYIAFIHKNLPIDATTAEKDVSLATFSLDKNQILTSRGVIKPEWIDALHNQQDVAILNSGYVVAVVKSNKFMIGALAAIPISYLDQKSHNIAMVLVPVGLLSGLILALVVYFWAKQQMGMPTALKSAIKRKEFFLVYQPIVNLQTGKCVGAEALIRWKRPNGEIIRPDLFIPIAEATGLIQLITEQVIEIIASESGELFKLHPDCHIAINLSPADVHSNKIVELLRSLTNKTGANTLSLVVEVTERGFLNADKARNVLHQIRSSGIRVAIDDFGTGYSSLSYLETFDLDYLKIDKSFVDTVGTEAATSHVVSHIIEMAKALNLEMVAEGVETEAQAKFLRDRGVQFAQGWLFGKPMALADIVSKLATVKT